MSIKFLVLGGGYFGLGGGGGKCRFYFYGRGDFGERILFKVPEAHHLEGHNPPRGSPRKFASQKALRGSLRGFCGGLSEGSAGSAGFCGVRGIFRGFFFFRGLVTLCLRPSGTVGILFRPSWKMWRIFSRNFLRPLFSW